MSQPRPSDDEDTKFLIGQLKLKKDQKEHELHYMPPRMEQGKFNPAIMVSHGNVVEAEEVTPVVTSESEPHSEEVTADIVRAEFGSECREDEFGARVDVFGSNRGRGCVGRW